MQKNGVFLFEVSVFVLEILMFFFLPSIRHFENRRGEGPGDEVEFDVTSGPRWLQRKSMEHMRNVTRYGSTIVDTKHL